MAFCVREDATMSPRNAVIEWTLLHTEWTLCMMSSWFVFNGLAETTEENSTFRAATWKVACSWSDLRDNRVLCSSSTVWVMYLNLGVEWPQRSTFEEFLSRLSSVKEWCLVRGFTLLTGGKSSKSIVGSQYFSLVLFPCLHETRNFSCCEVLHCHSQRGGPEI